MAQITFIPSYVRWNFLKEGFTHIMSIRDDEQRWHIVAVNPETKERHKWEGNTGSKFSFRGPCQYHEKGVNVIPGGFTLWHWTGNCELMIEGRYARPLIARNFDLWLENEVANIMSRLELAIQNYDSRD